MCYGVRWLCVALTVAGLALGAVRVCLAAEAGEVVVYTSIDEVPARKVLADFEKATGIRVKPLFDVEATKTTGLANRLASEKARPMADVFWNNELSHTLRLAGMGVFAPYASPSASDIPSQWKDPGNLWTSMGLRARVIVYNRKHVKAEDAPKSLEDLCDPKWRGKVAISDPRFGTCATHMGALFSLWGKEKTLDWARRLAANNVKVMAGNSVVRDAAASGEILAGLTDTDDVLLGISEGMEIALALPDQGDKDLGTLVIPNSVSLVAGGPNPQQGRKLADYLLSRDLEKSFSNPKEGWIPVRSGDSSAEGDLKLDAIKPMKVDWEAVSELVAPASAEVAKILVK